MDNPVQNIARLGIVLLATARVSRFFTSDFLGDWIATGPAKRWATEREGGAIRLDSESDDLTIVTASEVRVHHTATSDQAVPVDTLGWRSKLVHGLECPFCVGFWIGGVILLGEATIGRSPLRPLWRFGIAMLGLNYLVGHISSRIDG